MLDALDVIVADQAQLTDQGLPELEAVVVAHGAKDPGTVGCVGVGLGAIQRSDLQSCAGDGLLELP
jgi:hypothetical protein